MKGNLPVLVVTPNLCFDRTLEVGAFAPGTVSRPHLVRVTAGGKGVNVVRTLRDLGVEATLSGFVATTDGDKLRDLLHEESLEIADVSVDGTVRCATIILENSGRATVLNEPGPRTGRADLERLSDLVGRTLRAERTPVLVCSGSLPPGLPSDAYGQLVATARAAQAVSIVDAARDALVATLPFGPDVVTPNLAEAEGIVTGAVTESVDAEDVPVEESIERASAAGVRLLELGARRAVVTAGSHGAGFTDDDGTTIWIDAPRVRPVNPIGAGDSFVGGLAAGLGRGLAWREAVRFAVAVASAAVELPGAGNVDRARAESLAAGLAGVTS